MSGFDNPFDPDHILKRGGCSCGQHASQVAHEQAALANEEARIGDRKSVV